MKNRSLKGKRRFKQFDNYNFNKYNTNQTLQK